MNLYFVNNGGWVYDVTVLIEVLLILVVGGVAYLVYTNKQKEEKVIADALTKVKQVSENLSKEVKNV